MSRRPGREPGRSSTVLPLRTGGIEPMIHTIVVGADGSPGSQRAVSWAGERAQELGAEVVAVLAVRPLGEFVMELPPMPGHVMTHLREALERTWCKPLRDLGVKYRTVVVEDDPAHGLLDVVDREHADLLVLGAQGHGGVVHRALGSVTYKTTHHAECPVVIVPATTRSANTDGAP
jgi:nucleotide-binding universal stress UspA family protein